jgi:hypothetical protein
MKQDLSCEPSIDNPSISPAMRALMSQYQKEITEGRAMQAAMREMLANKKP